MRERDLAGRHGLFVAEGEIVVRALLSGASRFSPVALLASRSRARGSADLLATAGGIMPVFVAEQAVMDGIVGFPIHRGLLAMGRRPGPTAAPILPPPGGPTLVLALSGLANHDNVGAAFRNAAAFGADAVLLDAACCDPLYRKALRVSAGHALTVPFARRGTTPDVLGRLRAAEVEVFALSPAGGMDVDEVVWPERAALLLGSEGPGLPADILARTRTVRIRMAPGVDSLNVATAGAIALHAVRRQRTGPRIDGG